MTFGNIEEAVVKRRCLETSINCNAQFQVRNDESGQFQVRNDESGQYMARKFVPEHYHAVTPPHNSFLLMSRSIVSAAKKKIMDTCDSANIMRTNSMGASEVQSGEYQDISCTEKDVEDYGRETREEENDQDAHMFYQLLKYLKEINPLFIFNIEKDGEDRITHVFWANPQFRTSYYHFGDVVSFDTTYKTNCYGLIFGAFTGFNHHGESIMFGCGLLPNETFDSFVWLFKKWLDAMPGGPPKAIVTNRDLAITKAIQTVMPSTCHRFCLQHILDKLPMKLDGLASRKGVFWERLKHCIYNSEAPIHFELEWSKILEEFGVADNEKLRDLYNIREKWVPTYFKHVFFGGMTTTERSESINAFVKQYVSHKTTLYEFILRLERAIAQQKHLELKADHNTLNGKRKLKSPLPIEKQMAEIYTRKAFYKFQEELMMTMSYQAILVGDKEVESNYTVKNLVDEKEIQQLVLNKELKHAWCTCRMFEFEGIPCRHVLCVLIQAGITYLPKHYIVKRWTRHAREGRVHDSGGVVIRNTCEDSLVSRRSDLSSFATSLTDDASLTKTTYQFIEDSFADTHKKVQELILNQVTVAVDHSNRGKMPVDVHYRAPLQVVTRGRRKTPNGKSQTKARLCHGCNQRGVSHDKRNCPKLSRRCTLKGRNYANVSERPDDSSELSTTLPLTMRG